LTTSTTTSPADRRSEGDFDAFSDAFDAFVQAAKRSRSKLPEEALELSLSQFDVLRALDEEEGQLGVSGLAHAAKLSVPTVTRMLDGLERRGVVVRERGKRDRRVVRVSLTDSGRRLVAAKREVVFERRTALFESLSPSERRDAARLLHRLASALDET
jgi:DNA-binding MarR family transcriptional regulator